MSDTALILGPITFTDFEIPERISFGGSQRVAIHRTIGGGRVVDVLGADAADIAFRGVFSGSDAPARALEVDALRVAGLPLPLTWDVFFQIVVIRNFQADYRNPNWIPFSIICTVLAAPASSMIATAVSLPLVAQEDMSAGASAAAAAGVDLTATQASLAQPGAMTAGTTSYSAAMSAVGNARNQVGTALTGADTQIGALPSFAGGAPDAGIAGLASATASAGNLASLLNAQSRLGRLAVNLTNAST
jgi:hypothetical protein